MLLYHTLLLIFHLNINDDIDFMFFLIIMDLHIGVSYGFHFCALKESVRALPSMKIHFITNKLHFLNWLKQTY